MRMCAYEQHAQGCYAVGNSQESNQQLLSFRCLCDRSDDDDDDDDVVTVAADAAKVCLQRGKRGCCLTGSVLHLDRDDETRQQPGGLVAASSSSRELRRHPAPSTSPSLTTASVVKTTLVADDAQAQNPTFRSSFVQSFVDSGRRQKKFQRLTASDSGRHLCERVPVDSFVGHSVDGDTGKSTSPRTTATRHSERLTTDVHANTGAHHGHCRLLDDTEFKPELPRLLSSVTGHYIHNTTQYNTVQVYILKIRLKPPNCALK